MAKAGVDGVGQTKAVLHRYSNELVAQLRVMGTTMGQEMVTLARSRVPVRSGLLLSGITALPTKYPTIFEFRASAVGPKSPIDYARFVEFGTAGGREGKFREITSQAGIFGDRLDPDRIHPIRKRRRSRRTHGGSKAKPFFFNSAKEVMDKHRDDLRKCPAKIAESLGLKTE